jgi:hypothetical protein
MCNHVGYVTRRRISIVLDQYFVYVLLCTLLCIYEVKTRPTLYFHSFLQILTKSLCVSTSISYIDCLQYFNAGWYSAKSSPWKVWDRLEQDLFHCTTQRSIDSEYKARNISTMIAGKKGETGATNPTFQITQKITDMPMQSILKHIAYYIDTIWNSSTAFSSAV